MTILGIDLGTTFSAASIVKDGKPELLPIGGERIMPSVVAVGPDGRWLVGRPALNQWGLHPESTVRSIKRRMGTSETVLLNGQTFSPQQISALILQALKAGAESQLGETIRQAVITVPAYFSDAQRQATRDAGIIAGLEVLRIINEPTAAALAYGLEMTHEQVALVYDLGGGTFDVSLVEFSGGVVDVRASHGNTRLGGDDFDDRLARWLTEQVEARHGLDLRGDFRVLARIQRAAEQAKIALSTEPFVWVREEYLTQKDGVPVHLEIEVSRNQFISLIADLLDSTLASVDRVLKDGKIERPDQVLLVGGSTYIPAVWELVAERTGITPRQDVHPSEAVALGAGVQGAIIAGEPIEAILVDVTPFSLGIAVAEPTPGGGIVADRFKVLIHRNTTIPTSQQEIFSAITPDQRTVEIEVYQGESRIASQNTLLGQFLFEQLVPEQRGMPPRVLVAFDMDVNGILNVRAVDRGSGKAEGITVKASRQRLSQTEITSARLALPEDFLVVSPELPAELVKEAQVALMRAGHIANALEQERGEDDPDLVALDDLIGELETALQYSDADNLSNAYNLLMERLFDLESGEDEEDESEI